MRWMLYGSVRPEAADALRERGDAVVDPASLEPAPADLPAFLETAQHAQNDILTDASALPAAVYEASFPFRRSIVYLQSEGDHAAALARLFDRYKRLVPGRLYTVTGSRVKVRQLPGA